MHKSSCFRVNFPDILIVEGKYQFKTRISFFTGAETAGEIYSLGENISNFKIGQKVIAMPGHGAFAEYCISPVKKLILLMIILTMIQLQYYQWFMELQLMR